MGVPAEKRYRASSCSGMAMIGAFCPRSARESSCPVSRVSRKSSASSKEERLHGRNQKKVKVPFRYHGKKKTSESRKGEGPLSTAWKKALRFPFFSLIPKRKGGMTEYSNPFLRFFPIKNGFAPLDYRSRRLYWSCRSLKSFLVFPHVT